jgi:flagellar hook-associated protein 1 FlgK
VNTAHEAGFGLDGVTGRPFFEGTNASDIKVSAAVEASTDAIAAASAPQTGQPVAPDNGDNALQVADLANAQLLGGQTVNGYYSTAITQIGRDEQNYTQLATNQQQVMTQLQNQRNSTSGVNLDEELTNMLQYQKSYQSAAKFLSTVDTLMQNLLDAVTP